MGILFPPVPIQISAALENVTLDAERWLAALYWCVRTSYGDDAAHAAADCWLRIFEERFEGSSGLPELTRITVAAIVVFFSNHRQAVYWPMLLRSTLCKMVQIRSSGSGRLGMTCWLNQAIVTMLPAGRVAHSPGRIAYASDKLPYNRLVGHLSQSNG